MDIALMILAGLLLAIGLLGSVIPVLPGIPLGYIALLLMQLTSNVHFSTSFLLIWLAIVVVLQVLDYFLPTLVTKRFGGTKWGLWGSMVGLLVGLFFGLYGVVLGPFLGAVIGELLNGTQTRSIIKVSFGTFVGTFVGVVAKLIVSGIFIYYYIDALISIFEN